MVRPLDIPTNRCTVRLTTDADGTCPPEGGRRVKRLVVGRDPALANAGAARTTANDPRRVDGSKSGTPMPREMGRAQLDP